MLVPSTSALLFLVASISLVYCRIDDFIIASGRNGVNHAIYWAPLNSDSERFTRIPIQNGGIPEDVTYDPIDNQIFWIETDRQQLNPVKLSDGNNADQSCKYTTKIYSVDLEGGPPQLHCSHFSQFSRNCQSTGRPIAPAKIAIDGLSRSIFWVSYGADGTVNLLKTSINTMKTVGVSDAEGYQVSDLFVDSQNRKIYWCPSTHIGAIQRMNIDGTNLETIADQLLWVSGVAFDQKAYRLFLTNNDGYDLIDTLDLKNNPDNNIVGFHNDATGMSPSNPALSDTHIYWIMNESDSLNSRRIFKMPLHGGDQPHVKVNTDFDVDCLYIHRDASSEGGTTSSSTTSSANQIPITKAYSISSNPSSLLFGTRLKRILVFTGFGLLVLLVICLSCTMICVLKKRNKCRGLYGVVDEENQTDAAAACPDEDGEQALINNEVANAFLEREIDRDRLEVVHLLGNGCYGVVYQAYLHDDDEPATCVALKTLKDNVTPDTKERFLEEIKLHIEIGSHPNIVCVLGCVTISEPFCMITEFMKYGDLQKFLWKCNKDENIMKDRIYDLSDLDQLHIARQIAKGMEFLSTTRYYHGDLAARNILVGEDLVVKISDFGMADDIYTEGYKRIAPEKKRPVKWVSLETNMTGQCTMQSDVWSYGIVLYEIYSLGGTPYPGMTCMEVIVRLKEGYRMEKFDACPDEIYRIMSQCWLEHPVDRPTFTLLLRKLDGMIQGVTQDRHYQNVCERDRPISDISNDEAFIIPPYVQIADQKNALMGTEKDGKESRGRVRSGEPDEHNLWKHLTKEKKTSSSSVEFVPTMAEEDANKIRPVFV